MRKYSGPPDFQDDNGLENWVGIFQLWVDLNFVGWALGLYWRLLFGIGDTVCTVVDVAEMWMEYEPASRRMMFFWEFERKSVFTSQREKSRDYRIRPITGGPRGCCTPVFSEESIVSHAGACQTRWGGSFHERLRSWRNEPLSIGLLWRKATVGKFTEYGFSSGIGSTEGRLDGVVSKGNGV